MGERNKVHQNHLSVPYVPPKEAVQATKFEKIIEEASASNGETANPDNPFVLPRRHAHDGGLAAPHGGALCALCKGSRLLCGKASCSVLVKYNTFLKSKPLIDDVMLDGASPPSVFVGRIGYPHVTIGPMIPPIHGDTTEMDLPEKWVGKSIEDIVGFRSQLVRGKYRVKVTDAYANDRIIDETREVALATNSIEMEAEFHKKPSGKIVLNDDTQPYGPSAPLKMFKTDNIKMDNRMEKAHYDSDLLARDAVVGLYDRGVLLSKIQRAFSVGAFGEKKRRKFVPTRWSITAVDDTIGLTMIPEVKNNPLINEFRIYENVGLDNRWQVLMMPTSWRYELIEAWYPNTAWNPYGMNIEIFSDAEFYDGRTKYAQIGGCYYAARLASCELLLRERRQAGVVIMREAHPGYIMPVGVWNVREHVRAALRTKPHTFPTLNDALVHVGNAMDISIKRWIHTSSVLKDILHQKRLEDF